MGCDIHFYVECKEGEQWFSADEWTPNKYYEMYRESERPMTVEYERRMYTERNYDLFAILANVRNGRGFAGIKTGEGFKPIALPRGLPADVSPEVRGESDGWGEDGHSHSWLTVQELLDYDWDQSTTHTGVVDAANYLVWRHEGKPRAWAGDVAGTRVKHVSAEEIERAISFGHSEGLYTRVEWSEPYRRSVGRFLEETLPKLQAIGPADHTRIVFWFDN